MYKIAALLALVALASAASMEINAARSFAQFKADFGKAYETPAEEARRFAVFQEKLAFINKHNEEAAAGLHSYTVGINQFADLTQAEFKKMYLSSPFNRTMTRNTVYLPEAPMASSVDWRTKGAVTPVKNQGQCGSCWSFSTTGSTEGAHAIATGKLVSLSEQQLCDCSRAYGNQGCNGGLMDNAFKYIIANGGLDTEEDYPYTAVDGTCNKAKEAKKVVSITGYKDVAQNNENQLAAAVAIGPVSVAIEADQMGFQNYKSGVFDGICGHQLDHGVLAVGYTDDYWIVKNSWGESWGDQGYIMMKRGVSAEGICGIAMEPSYPVASSGPSPSPPPSPPSPSPSPSPPPPPPGNYDYEKPNPGCHAGELAVQVTGLSGDFCSPSCSTTKPCPTNYPPGTSGSTHGECILEMSGSSKPTQCALMCDPSASTGCPTGASCQPIQGLGICTYP